MITNIRRFAAALLAVLGLSSMPVSAGTTFGTDYTDLWFNPSEQGWGVNVIQQYETIFATLFVYGADNSARWYVASDLRGGANNFSGTLYQTTGPNFSGPWSGTANATPVGSMTLTFSSATTGTLSYVVNGASVTKQIQRQTWRTNVLAGQFIGGYTANASNCTDAGSNGPALATGLLRVTNNGGSMTVEFRNAANVAATCTYSGTFSSSGRLGTLTGTYTCSLGSNGTFTMTEVDVGRNGFSALYSAQDQFCRFTGFFGGIRDVLGN
ncbi:MAG TPA: hypothetical protein VEC19_13300 [Usitatibacter sp.]|nr:hypothetical protein [Usitatibacter sp.]